SSLEGRLMAILRADANRAPLGRRAEVLLTVALVALLAPIAAIRVVAEPAKEHRVAASSIELPVQSDAPSDEPPDEESTATDRWQDLGPAESKSGEQWAELGQES